MPIGQNSLVQQYVALQVRYEFEFFRKSTAVAKQARARGSCFSTSPDTITMLR